MEASMEPKPVSLKDEVKKLYQNQKSKFEDEESKRQAAALKAKKDREEYIEKWVRSKFFITFLEKMKVALEKDKTSINVDVPYDVFLILTENKKDGKRNPKMGTIKLPNGIKVNSPFSDIQAAFSGIEVYAISTGKDRGDIVTYFMFQWNQNYEQN